MSTLLTVEILKIQTCQWKFSEERGIHVCITFYFQRISIEVVDTPEQSDVDIDGLFKTYAHALQREINATDLVSQS
jgi:hypothetical protein